MKAALFYGPGDMRVEQVDKPKPSPDEVLIQVKACAICGTDVRIYSHGQSNVEPPQIIGHEIAGIVSEVGENVENCTEGERVILVTCVGCGVCDFCLQGRVNLCKDLKAIGYYYSGGFTEYMLVPSKAVQRGNILPISENLPFDEAALAEPLSCCINGQEYLNIDKGDTVVIIGAGPIGCMHTELARVSGATRIILADISSQRLELAGRVDADIYVNSKEENLVEKVLGETGGEGADVVITACPSPEAQQQSLEMTRARGRISFFGGLPHDRSRINFDSNIIHYKEISVYGVFASHHVQFKKASALLSSGRIPGEKFITHRFSLDEIEKGLKKVKSGEALKAVVTM